MVFRQLKRIFSRPLLFVLVTLLSLVNATGLHAEPNKNELSASLVQVKVGRDARWATGAVVKSDPYNGYVLVTSDVSASADRVVVQRDVNRSSRPLTAQLVSTDTKIGLALLKVNGLNVASIKFAKEPPELADSVWSASKLALEGSSIVLARGAIHSESSENGYLQPGFLKHNATVGAMSVGSVLLNNCGELLGYSPYLESTTELRAVGTQAIIGFLRSNGILVSTQGQKCVSEVELAQAKAEKASFAALDAQAQADTAQAAARKLAAQLEMTKEQNQQLSIDSLRAQATADAAIAAARAAQQHAEETRRELERQTAAIVAETEAIVAHLQSDSAAAEARFSDALESQRTSATQREDFLITGFVLALLVLVGLLLLLQRFGFRPSAVVDALQARPVEKSAIGEPQLNAVTRAEYVLDGRDDEGVRHLVKISGNQLAADKAVVIGRNPLEAPCLIDHVDVSRQHARIKVMKGRLFIEDLGSTNGTSVNGLAIDDKGPVSVSNGDQIIIGSVVMKLRVSGE